MTSSTNFQTECVRVDNMRGGGFMRLPAILALIPVGKSSIWEMVARGDFPKPVKLSRRVTAWRCNDIKAFIDSRGCGTSP